jgi:5-phospho-D-xylono-1,4-lactonase
MKFIRTVNADININDLGWCQCHEHLLIEKCKSFEVDPSLYLDDVDKSLCELKSYVANGGKSYLDAQPFDTGRMAENLSVIANVADANIVATTGFHKSVFYYDNSYIFKNDVNELTDFYISEIEDGMLSSISSGAKRLENKAGVVKVAVEAGDFLAGHYAKLFEAVVHAANATHVSVLCHMDKDADALGVVKYFEDGGIRAEKLILCHLDRAKYDFEYHKDVAKTGAFLEYDTINRLKYHSNEMEIKLIIHMIENGFVNQLLFSLDTTAKRLKNYGATFGLDFILTEFVKMLDDFGVAKETIQNIMVQNPKLALAINI